MSNAVDAVLVAMQSEYLYRLLRVAIPFRGSSLILSHIFPVLGPAEFHFWKRCSSSWFPAYMLELGSDADLLLMLRRDYTHTFAFCVVLLYPRTGALGAALGDAQRA